MSDPVGDIAWRIQPFPLVFPTHICTHTDSLYSSATVTFSNLVAGWYVPTFTYSGDANWLAGGLYYVTQIEVAPISPMAASTTTLSISPTSISGTQAAQFTTTVAGATGPTIAPTGLVYFFQQRQFSDLRCSHAGQHGRDQLGHILNQRGVVLEQRGKSADCNLLGRCQLWFLDQQCSERHRESNSGRQFHSCATTLAGDSAGRQFGIGWYQSRANLRIQRRGGSVLRAVVQPVQLQRESDYRDGERSRNGDADDQCRGADCPKRTAESAKAVQWPRGSGNAGSRLLVRGGKRIANFGAACCSAFACLQRCSLSVAEVEAPRAEQRPRHRRRDPLRQAPTPYW